MPTFGVPTYAGRPSNGGTLSVPVPGDLKAGDLLVVALRSQNSVATDVWTAPVDSGFVLLSADQVPDPGNRTGAIFAKTVEDPSLEPPVYVFTGPWNRAVGTAIACTPDSADSLKRVTGARYGGIPMQGGISYIPAHDLTGAPALSFLAMGAECVDGVSHVPTITPPGFTAIASGQSSMDESTTASRTSIWLGWRAEPDLAVERLEGEHIGGASTSMYLGTFMGGTTGPVVPVEPEPGFRSVAQMLATPGATWAHRGGSRDWPEMSEMAYRNSALAGYGALEFSCGRSSDGVWFGLHDTTLNRTSETTGLPNVNTMTWAEIQEYSISLNANGDPQPYFKMTDFLDIYASTHVVIMDIKYGWSFATEWFDILKSYSSDRQRIIVKYFGPTSFSAQMQTYVRESGFSSWGYYYPEQVADGELERTQDHWSILGMDYGASQADWDAILAYGKPVVGHIVQSPTSAAMALDKGAHMLQCASVSTIPPVGPPEGAAPWDAVYAGGSRIPASGVRVGTQRIWP